MGFGEVGVFEVTTTVDQVPIEQIETGEPW